MQKKTRPIVSLVLVAIAAVLLWKLVPWRTLAFMYDMYATFTLASFYYYSTVVIFALLLMAVIWFVLDKVPKRQARALLAPQKKTIADEQGIDEDGSLYIPQSSIKPTELFSIENEARKTLSQIIGGFIVIVSLILTGANLAVTQRETEKNRSLALEGQITDRFTKAIAQLGDEKIEVRLGGIYALERVANDSEKDYWTIMEVLTAYVRENAPLRETFTSPTPKASSKKPASELVPQVVKLPTDIQAILTVIGRRKANFGKSTLDLNNTSLRNAVLREAYLFGASLRYVNLTGADLSRANLGNVDLTGADLSEAYFEGANFLRANLFKAVLRKAHFRGANLGEANISGTYLEAADLSGAILRRAQGLSWEQVSTAYIDDNTQLPPEIEAQHKDELKAMRERTRIH